MTLTGGEPLLRADLTELAAEAAGMGMAVAVATNGTLLDRRSARRLARSGVAHFDIGLPSFHPPTYRGLCGANPTAPRRAVRAAAESGATVTVSVCLTAQNYRGVGATVETSAALGADAVCLNRFVPTGRGSHNRKGLALPLEMLKETLAQADRAAARTGIVVFPGVPVEPCLLKPSDHPHLRYTGCLCSTEKWAIGPDGGLRCCEQNPVVLGSLLENGFSSLATLEQVEKFRSRLSRRECRGCPHLEQCRGGCRFLSPDRFGENTAQSPGIDG